MSSPTGTGVPDVWGHLSDAHRHLVATGQLADWKKQPGMLGVRFTFHTEVLRQPLLDGRFDWVWGELENSVAE